MSISVSGSRYGIERKIIHQKWPEHVPKIKAKQKICREMLNTLSLSVAHAVRILDQRIADPHEEIFQCDAETKAVQYFNRVRKALEYGQPGMTMARAKGKFGTAYGSLIHLEAYHLLDAKSDVTEGAPGDYLTETSLKHDDLFAASYRETSANPTAIPDLRVALGDGYEAVYDITSAAQIEHVASRHRIMSNSKVLFVAEVGYPTIMAELEDA